MDGGMCVCVYVCEITVQGLDCAASQGNLQQRALPAPLAPPGLNLRTLGSHLSAARAARLPQNIPEFLQVAADRGGHSQGGVEARAEPGRGRMSPRAVPEGRGDPGPARSPPRARAAAPSGPRREAPPTAVRHFTLCPPARDQPARWVQPRTSALSTLPLSASLDYHISRFRGGSNMDPCFPFLQHPSSRIKPV